MENNFYRLVIDFQFGDDEIISDLVNVLEDSVMEVLDPEHPAGTPCARDFIMVGKVVTEEYANEEIEAFTQELKQQDTVDEFLQRTHFKDYPKE